MSSIRGCESPSPRTTEPAHGRATLGAASGYEIYKLSGEDVRHVERRGPVLHKEGHGPQEASAVIRHLEDCQVFVGGSMGRRSQQLLLEQGIAALVAEAETVEEALQHVLPSEGVLRNTERGRAWAFALALASDRNTGTGTDTDHGHGHRRGTHGGYSA